MEALRTGLTDLIHRRDFYDAESWKSVSLGKEARDYLARDRASLSEDELARMNRLAVEGAFSAHFRRRSPHSISLTYLGFEITPRLPFSQQQAETFIKEVLLSGTMNWVVGPFGMIAALLVTSTIIPQMFDPGSITLLMSKPVSKSLLFVAKFIGGCAVRAAQRGAADRRAVADFGDAVRHLEPRHPVVHSRSSCSCS